jgi:hypothetical protein
MSPRAVPTRCSTSLSLSVEVTGGHPFLNAAAAVEWLTPGRLALLLGLLIVATFAAVWLGSTGIAIRDFGTLYKKEDGAKFINAQWWMLEEPPEE